MSRESALKAWETMRARREAGLPSLRSLNKSTAETPISAPPRRSPARSQRPAPQIPDDSVVGYIRDTTNDAAEWLKVQEEYQQLWTGWRIEVDCKPVGVTNRPHPKSYGAHLPMRGVLGDRRTKKWAPPKAEPVTISATAPHPDSYGSDLPMRGLGLNTLEETRNWKLTAHEKALCAARPLTYTTNV